MNELEISKSTTEILEARCKALSPARCKNWLKHYDENQLIKEELYNRAGRPEVCDQFSVRRGRRA